MEGKDSPCQQIQERLKDLTTKTPASKKRETIGNLAPHFARLDEVEFERLWADLNDRLKLKGPFFTALRRKVKETRKELKKSPVEIAKSKFSEGMEALKRHSFSEAVELFGQAAYLDSSQPAYYFHMGLALVRERKYREAERVLREALKHDPFNPDYLAELGHIYLKLDLYLRAKSSFESALKYDPSHEKAASGLQNCNPE